ncbi:hypothetical protein [Limnobaculum zhutongyuii]|uniref:hypothetical protein n=1 Tax=Limnobaculum zhutongyuii TaxID=2498113 RepID=UPI001FEAC826|nr:hypothetical protein [Limnobaculum zhutongyuii]
MIKKLILATIVVASFSSHAISAEEYPGVLSLLPKALAGDYISQRNLAYSYMNGWGKEGANGYIPKDPISGCAWRKLILLTNKNADFGDAGNESVDCSKIHPTDNAKVWEKVHAGIQLMSKLNDINNKGH